MNRTLLPCTSFLQFLQGLVLLSAFLLVSTSAFVFLQPIDLPSIEFYTVDMLRQAALPSDLDNTLSIVISEAFAGAVGAYASRRTSNAIGSAKKDPLIVKISSTSVFFGTRGLVRGIARLAGLPRPLSVALAAVAGSLISESAKVLGRSINHSNNHSSSINSSSSNSSSSSGSSISSESNGSNSSAVPEDIIDIAEFSGDVTKWVVYDSLVGLNAFTSTTTSTTTTATTTLMENNIDIGIDGIFGEEISCAAYGAMASVSGLYVNKLLNEARNSFRNRNSNSENSTQSGVHFGPSKKVDGAQFKFALSEGAALFGSYNFIQHVLAEVIPSQFNFKFQFNQLVQELEDELVD